MLVLLNKLSWGMYHQVNYKLCICLLFYMVFILLNILIKDTCTEKAFLNSVFNSTNVLSTYYMSCTILVNRRVGFYFRVNLGMYIPVYPLGPWGSI